MSETVPSSSADALNRILDGHQPFAIIQREGGEEVDVYEGTMEFLDTLNEVAQKRKNRTQPGIVDTICAVPYSSIKTEREYPAVTEDGENKARIQCLQVTRVTHMKLRELLSRLPVDALKLGTITDSHTDEEYEELVRNIIENEIGKGEGANFVLPRSKSAEIEGFQRSSALSIFHTLLNNEFGTYMTGVFSNGKDYLIFASPERQLTVEPGELELDDDAVIDVNKVTMNPISGTLRKTKNAADDGFEFSEKELTEFLNDEKEIMELFMVLDEELKMMARMCEKGGKIKGPKFKEMSKLLHTEYELEGMSELDVLELLIKSMWAPTVTGSPVENACRVIAKHDSVPRRFYSAALVLLGRDKKNRDTLDSTILIRTIEIVRGVLTMMAGTTIVRDSNPPDEAREASVKLAAPLASLEQSVAVAAKRCLECFPPAIRSEVEHLLKKRNTRLSEYHFEDQRKKCLEVPRLRGKKITIIDNEDDFCYILRNMIQHMGADVTVVRYNHFKVHDHSSDIVILGPGPGDPNDEHCKKMQCLGEIAAHLKSTGQPLLGICLGHQILCKELKLDVVQKQDPAQGVCKEIDFFGDLQRVGFYNTFAAKKPEVEKGVQYSSDPETGEVHALRGKKFAGSQFHVESVLTTDGYDMLADFLLRVLPEEETKGMTAAERPSFFKKNFPTVSSFVDFITGA
ncbi:chorismate-binding protein [Candidatus Peregrinibacteria bacterium CG10_big_fil_rev_8_21_14_0_10_49_10]|nr:MAG: chorismate-binding protein [Candidatus Peregrinibacteria bacterium CG10_big_fil_rev_8_21_14_0_10_49_10]